MIVRSVKMVIIVKKLSDPKTFGIIRDFLKYPHDRDNFNEFFNICYYHTVGYLRYLKAKGVTIELHDADEYKSLMDLAYDILGDFLHSGDNRPFYVIFDYFSRHKITDFDNTDLDILYDHFTILLRGFVRKILYKNRKEQNPQAANLERRIIDILKSDKYDIFKQNPDSAEYICLAKNKDRLRREYQPLLLADLLTIVYSVFSKEKCNNRIDWVNNIFSELEIATEFQNFIKKNDLIRAMIHINESFIELDGGSPFPFPHADSGINRRAIDEEKINSLEYAEVMAKDYVGKGKITPHEAELILIAAEKYLTDFAFDGQTDKIPTYFFEIIPGCSQEKYLKKYKYIFEMIINKSRDDFIDRLINIL